ncbi:MAG: hypothetical protein CEN90_1 [Parcubacteria group bacterium Licking1014_17]|nr:MAG: hypothetical protein CEN90_1 [Parcubacteria group bacterium Licking1014_17]
MAHWELIDQVDPKKGVVLAGDSEDGYERQDACNSGQNVKQSLKSGQLRLRIEWGDEE